MTIQKYTQFNVHNFSNLETAKFSPQEYSRLKFGSDVAAKKLGYELATEFFAAHSDIILANQCVVIPSPYNFVPNAATVMTRHFINKLNELSVHASGQHVEQSIIHRKVSYTNDYGFLSKEKRRGLIDNDSFYLNRAFLEGKVLFFVDDVKITGTHEDKLVQILEHERVPNQAVFIYYARYHGNSPAIEGELNFASIKTIEDLIELMKEANHQVIIRPIKFLLSQHKQVLKDILMKVNDNVLDNLYYGSLAEGYYTIPKYQLNFAVIVDERKRRLV